MGPILINRCICVCERKRSTFKKWSAISVWKWITNDDTECGICRLPFDGCCPDCRTPGDDCPLGTIILFYIFHKQSIWLYLRHFVGNLNLGGFILTDRLPSFEHFDKWWWVIIFSTFPNALTIRCFTLVIYSRKYVNILITLFHAVAGQCRHSFHMHCILKWLAAQQMQQQCPMCRQDWKFSE